MSDKLKEKAARSRSILDLHLTGNEVVTVEGVADGKEKELNPSQEAMVLYIRKWFA